jgi:hypothetical protein
MKPMLYNPRSLIITDLETLSFFHPKKFAKAEQFLWGIYNKTYVCSQNHIKGIEFSNN